MRIETTPSSAAAGGGYSTIQDEGTPLTQRTTLNFTGAAVTASDNGTLTIVNIVALVQAQALTLASFRG